MSRAPSAAANRSACSSSVAPPTSTSALGRLAVSGPSRRPKPAASTTTWVGARGTAGGDSTTTPRRLAVRPRRRRRGPVGPRRHSVPCGRAQRRHRRPHARRGASLPARLPRQDDRRALRRPRDDRPGLKENFARDVALLRLVGMKPIVVHGGGWRIDELLATMGMPSRRHGGVRVTDAKTLTVVEMALDEINQELTGLVNRHGGRAVGHQRPGRPLHPRACRCEPRGRRRRRRLRRRRRGHRRRARRTCCCPSAFVPVILPLGVAEDGTAYHIDSDRLAGRLARALKAEKLILMTNARRHHRRARPPRVHPDRAARSRRCSPSTRSPTTWCRARAPPSRPCAKACARCHIIDGGVRERAAARGADGRRRRHRRALRRGAAFPRGQPRLPARTLDGEPPCPHRRPPPWTGIYPIAPTPFDDAGDLDLAGHAARARLHDRPGRRRDLHPGQLLGAVPAHRRRARRRCSSSAARTSPAACR